MEFEEGDVRIARVYARIEKNVIGTSGCWRWLGAHTTDDRPEVMVNKKVWYVYRLLYVVEIGPIPEGLTLDHVVCQHGWCCNPHHCEPVTNSENVRRQLALRYADRTACPYGHSYEEFRRWDSRGHPWCAACNIRKNAERDAQRKLLIGPVDRCPRGHKYAEHAREYKNRTICGKCSDLKRVWRKPKQRKGGQDMAIS